MKAFLGKNEFITSAASIDLTFEARISHFIRDAILLSTMTSVIQEIFLGDYFNALRTPYHFPRSEGALCVGCFRVTLKADTSHKLTFIDRFGDKKQRNGLEELVGLLSYPLYPL